MTPSRLALVILAALLVLASTVGADPTMTIDADHPLTEQAAIDQYQNSGKVSAQLERIQLTITIEEGKFNHVLTLDYDEEIPRKIRFYLPAAYFYPQVMEGLASQNTELEADLKPVENGSYTSVTVKFDGKAAPVFHISKENSAVFWGRDSARGAVNESFGLPMPSLAGASPEWEYVPIGALDGQNATYPIDTRGKDLTVQYDDNPKPDEERWIGVPDCKDVSEQPVCKFEKQGVNETVYLFSTMEESPTVRYRRGGSVVAQLSGAVNDLLKVPGRLMDTLGGLFGVISYGV